MIIKNVLDVEFKEYGRVLENVEAEEIIKEMDNTPLPEDVIYIPSDNELEKLGIFEVMSESIFGQMPVQIGYCNGHNRYLNALEYHRTSEINIAATDLILMLGRQQDIEKDYTYDTAKVKAFLVPKGTVVEIFATTLHYAPCGVDGAGFKCAVILPRGTNYSLKAKSENADKGSCCENRLLAASNKWLIAHKEADIEDAFAGLKGENIFL